MDLLGADHRDRHERGARLEGQRHEPPAREALQPVAVAVVLPEPFRPFWKRDHGLLPPEQATRVLRRRAYDASPRQHRTEERRLVDEILDERPRLPSTARMNTSVGPLTSPV